MVEIIYFVASSVDGYIARSDGSVDWLEPFQNPNEDYGTGAFVDSVDGILMGRKSYDKMLEFGEWPYSNKPCYVMTSTPLLAIAPAVRTISTEPEKVVEQFALQGLKRIWLLGGSTLCRSFQTQKLVTEYWITIVPVFLGGGIPLFMPPIDSRMLSLSETRAFPDGVVQVRYRS